MHAHQHHRGTPQVLQLDIQGTPQAWISLEQAAVHVAKGSVAWFHGETLFATLRGGFNVARGRLSLIELHPIIALHGAARVNLFDIVPALGKLKLLKRDRFTCAYCARRLPERELQCEHIVPRSRSGATSWMNLVAACGPCNHRKADRTPEEARMQLVDLPHVPSHFEDFLLEGRHIRADVHEWLVARLPKGSRLS